MIIKKFETISIKPPSWYDKSTNFGYHEFSFINGALQVKENVASNTFGSDFDGGGSSGGGGSSV